MCYLKQSSYRVSATYVHIAGQYCTGVRFGETKRMMRECAVTLGTREESQ